MELSFLVDHARSIVGGGQFLGKSVINEPASILHNTIPAPKVFQSQLDHLIEQQIFETEERLLKFSPRHCSMRL